MEQHPLKILQNVFICYKDNYLQLANISFDKEIRKIYPITDRLIDWKEINSKVDWEKFKESYISNSISTDKITIDGRFMLLIPGTIDAHVHFNTPGYEGREDFEHGSQAAAAGGVTTVIDMPCTSIPAVTSVSYLNKKLGALKNRCLVDYALWGGISAQMFSKEEELEQNVFELAEAGVVGFKAYLISGMPDFSDLTLDQMKKAASYVKKSGKILAIHAEDKKLVQERQKKYQQQKNNTWQAYCSSRDVKAETTAIQNLIEICRETGCPIHIVHISSEKGVELVRQARSEGLPVTTETCPHYLYFTSADFENPTIRNLLKTAPPVKNQEDKEALWKALLDGTISFVTTDHAGCDPRKEKSSDNFWEVYGGIPGVEHRVPFLFSEGVKKQHLTIQQVIALVAENPAQFFHLSSKKGSLKPGYDADFALIDLWTEQNISADSMHSKGKYTPFEGQVFSASVQETFLRGKSVFRQGQQLEKFGYGQCVRPL